MHEISFTERNVSEEDEEQLLEGVDIARSITCHEEDTCKDNKHYTCIHCDNKENINYMALLIENQQLHKQNEILRKKHSLTLSSKRQSLTKQSINQTRNQSVTKSINQYNQPVNTKLYHFLGKCSSNIQSIKNLVTFEQYCHIEKVSQKFDSLIDGVGLMIDQFNRQKIVLEKQIKVLHKINSKLLKSLQNTSKKLDEVINIINSTPNCKLIKHSNDLDAFLENENIQTQLKKRTISTPFHQSPFGFARTFSHSLEQIQLLSIKEDEIEQGCECRCEKCVDKWVQIIVRIKKLANGQNTQYQSIYQYAKSEKLKQWLQQIYQNIGRLNKSIQIQNQQLNIKSKTIQTFLANISNSSNVFINKIQLSKQKATYLFNILMIFYITYIQIVIEQTHHSTNNISIKQYNYLFWREVTKIRLKSGIQLSSQIQNYLKNMEQFLDKL